MTEQVAANLLSVPTQLLAEELLTDILVPARLAGLSASSRSVKLRRPIARSCKSGTNGS